MIILKISVLLIILYALYGPLPTLWIRKFYRRPEVGDFLLTFDDGPTEGVTERVIALLKQSKRPAVFFILGKNLPFTTNIVDELDKNFELGLHGTDHINYLLTGPIQTWRDIKTAVLIARDYGLHPHYFRAPYGAYNIVVLILCRYYGLSVLQWDHLLNDWEDPSPEILEQRIQKNAKNGAIIVLHDGTEGTAASQAKFDMVEALTRFLNAHDGNSDIRS